jgi:hypothetical protein
MYCYLSNRTKDPGTPQWQQYFRRRASDKIARHHHHYWHATTEKSSSANLNHSPMAGDATHVNQHRAPTIFMWRAYCSVKPHCVVRRGRSFPYVNQARRRRRSGASLARCHITHENVPHSASKSLLSHHKEEY